MSLLKADFLIEESQHSFTHYRGVRYSYLLTPKASRAIEPAADLQSYRSGPEEPKNYLSLGLHPYMEPLKSGIPWAPHGSAGGSGCWVHRGAFGIRWSGPRSSWVDLSKFGLSLLVTLLMTSELPASLLPLMSHVVTSEFFNEEQLRQDARGKLKSLAECTVASSLNAQGASAILSGTALLSVHVGNILLGRAPFGYSGRKRALAKMRTSIRRPKPSLTFGTDGRQQKSPAALASYTDCISACGKGISVRNVQFGPCSFIDRACFGLEAVRIAFLCSARQLSRLSSRPPQKQQVQ